MKKEKESAKVLITDPNFDIMRFVRAVARKKIHDLGKFHGWKTSRDLPETGPSTRKMTKITIFCFRLALNAVNPVIKFSRSICDQLWTNIIIKGRADSNDL